MLKIIRVCCFAFIFCVVAEIAQAGDEVFNRVMKTRTINCGYFVWPPAIFKDANMGRMSGINYDIMEAIGGKLGLKINWMMEVGPGDINAALEANKFDVMCATMWPSPARFANTTFTSRAEFYNLMHMVARAADHRFDEGLPKADDSAIKVTGIEGDVTADIAVEKLPHATHVFLGASATLADMFMSLATKKADVLFVDKASVSDYLKSNPATIKIVDEAHPVRVYGEHLMVRLGEQNLKNALDMALLQLTNDGLLEELTQKYARKFDTTIYPPKKDISR